MTSPREIRSAADLIGRWCAVPTLTGRGRWWVCIMAVSECKQYVKVGAPEGSQRAFGRPRWVNASDIMWKTKRDARAYETWLQQRPAMQNGAESHKPALGADREGAPHA